MSTVKTQKYKLREGSKRNLKIGGKQASWYRAAEFPVAEAEQYPDDLVVAKKEDGIPEGLILTADQKKKIERDLELQAKVKASDNAKEEKMEADRENAQRVANK